jgi:hypothetical protein
MTGLVAFFAIFCPKSHSIDVESEVAAAGQTPFGLALGDRGHGSAAKARSDRGRKIAARKLDLNQHPHPSSSARMAKRNSQPDGKALVIVESPAKARTISKFLGRDFTVEASIGHVRDLPQGAKQIPAEFKGEDWAYLGVNVNQDFDPV